MALTDVTIRNAKPRDREYQLTARRVRAFGSRVFRYAVATVRAKADPAGLLLGAVAAPQPKHLAAINDAGRGRTSPRHVGQKWPPGPGSVRHA